MASVAHLQLTDPEDVQVGSESLTDTNAATISQLDTALDSVRTVCTTAESTAARPPWQLDSALDFAQVRGNTVAAP
jgi:hypothetical protein